MVHSALKSEKYLGISRCFKKNDEIFCEIVFSNESCPKGHSHGGNSVLVHFFRILEHLKSTQ